MNFPGFEDPIPNLSDFPYYVSQSYPADIGPTEFPDDLASLFPPVNPPISTSHDFSESYNADEFLNFDGNASDASSTQAAPVEEARPSDTARPYIPPSGAFLSSTRRVGGTWGRPPPASPVDQSPPRSAWGVHA
jgi:hypothetical protein